MEYFTYQPGMSRFMDKDVLYSTATLPKSAGAPANQTVIYQKKPNSMPLPWKGSRVSKSAFQPVVPYAKYRVVKKYANSTKSVFVAKVLYHRVLYK